MAFEMLGAVVDGIGNSVMRLQVLESVKGVFDFVDRLRGEEAGPFI